MSSSTENTGQVEIEVQNIGGIDQTTVSLDPGVTILSGRNATNRTSLLQAIMAAHGSENATVKADADNGQVELTIGDSNHKCQVIRENGKVSISGDPYLENTELADLFAFLLEGNEARRAVERGDDLRDIIMQPVNTDQIQTEIRQLESKKEELDTQLEELDQLERRLPALEEKNTELKDQLEEKQEDLKTKEQELEQADASLEDKREVKNELDSKLDELRKTRSSLEDAQYELETEEQTLATLKEEQSDIEIEYEELPDTSFTDVERIEQRLNDLHSQREGITADLNQLQTIIQFNEKMLENGQKSLLSSSDLNSNQEEGESITDQLLKDEQTVTCWTCGSNVVESSIGELVEELREFRQLKLQEKRDVESEIEKLQKEKQKYLERNRRANRLEQELENYEEQISQTEKNIENLEATISDLEEDVTTLESAVNELEVEEQTKLLDLHKEVSQLEVEIGKLKDDVAEVQDEIESVNDRLEDKPSLEHHRDEVQSELQELRGTVDNLEQEAVKEFNDHMEALIKDLGFQNLERIWLERKKREAREGRRKYSKNAFEMHVVRKSDDETIYEDTIDHLSESEREVVGLVFGLAGYLVQDVFDSVPFILLDSVEALDADRIARLVEYFADFADYLVVALLAEDAAKLDDNHNRISEI